MRRLAAIASILFTAGPAGAHPGHGAAGSGQSLVHYLTEPAHVAVLCSILVAGAAFHLLRRRQQCALRPAASRRVTARRFRA